MSADPTYSILSETQLISAALERDERAWRELLSRYRNLIFRCIQKVAVRYRAILSSEDAEEIFGELCLQLIRHDMFRLRAFDPARGSRLGSWLGLLAAHATYDFIRQAARIPRSDQLEVATQHSDDAPNALERLLLREQRRQLEELLETMSRRERSFFELYYTRGLAPEKVADTMKISLNTVYSKKNKLRTKLLDRAHDLDWPQGRLPGVRQTVEVARASTH
jgi:RNA polymerase sigma-70 factor (ECF subfamily)